MLNITDIFGNVGTKMKFSKREFYINESLAGITFYYYYYITHNGKELSK